MHPLALSALIALGITMLLVPRRYAILPMAILASFIAPAQRVVIFTLNFDLLRLMVIIGWTRLLVRRELGTIKLQTIDVLLVLWAVSTTTIYSLRETDPRAIVYMLGVSFDCIGMY